MSGSTLSRKTEERSHDHTGTHNQGRPAPTEFGIVGNDPHPGAHDDAPTEPEESAGPDGPARNDAHANRGLAEPGWSRGIGKVGEKLRKPADLAKLWELSEGDTGIEFDVPKVVAEASG